MGPCAICGKPACRLYEGRIPLCLDDYSNARVRRLNDDDATKLAEALEGRPAPIAGKRRGTPEPEAAVAEDAPAGELAAGEGGD